MENDGGIRRGDRADTDDNEAFPDDSGLDGSGEGPGELTGDASALGGGPGASYVGGMEELGIGDAGGIDDLTIKSADDPSLGLTGTPDNPEEDWVAGSGPSGVPRRR